MIGLGRIALNGHEGAAVGCNCRPKCRFDHKAVRRIGYKGCEPAFALARRKGDDALRFLFSQEAQQINAIASHFGIIRKSDNRHIARPRHDGGCSHRFGEQGAQHNFSAFIEGFGGRRLRAFGRSPVIFDDQLNIGVVALEQGEFRGLLHALGNNG